MPTFTEDQIEELWGKANSIPERSTVLVKRLLEFKFRTSKAEEFATHGLARRIEIITHNVRRVFEELPPDLQGIPSGLTPTFGTPGFELL